MTWLRRRARAEDRRSASTPARGGGAVAETVDGDADPDRAVGQHRPAARCSGPPGCAGGRCCRRASCSRTLVDGSSMGGGYFDLGLGRVQPHPPRHRAARRLRRRRPPDRRRGARHRGRVPRAWGRASVCTNFPYDVAAAALIVQEAGGVVTHADGRALDDHPAIGSSRGEGLAVLGAANAGAARRLLAAVDRGSPVWLGTGSARYTSARVARLAIDRHAIVLIVIGVLVVLLVLCLILGLQRPGLARGTGSTTRGRRSTCSSSAATTSSRTWSRRSRATPPTSARRSRPSPRPAPTPSTPQGPAQQAQAENVLTGALKSLFAVAEAYPDLKANQNFLQPAGGAHVHRGPHRVLAAVLQRQRAELQHQDPAVPVGDPRRQLQLRSARVLRRRARATPSRCRSSSRPAPPSRSRHATPCTSRSRATSAARSSSSLGFVGLIAAGRARARPSCCSAGWVGVVIAVRHRRRRWRSSRTSTPTRSRSRPAAPSRPTRPSTGATTTSSRACASRPGSRSRGSTWSTTPRRTRSPPGATPSTPRIAVTTGLLEKMNRVELEGVLAHELSHVKNYDILVTTVAVIAVGAIALLADIGLRFAFWGGMQRPARQQRLRPARGDHRASSRSRCSCSRRSPATSCSSR